MDDSLVFFNANVDEAVVLKEIISDYARASSQ